MLRVSFVALLKQYFAQREAEISSCQPFYAEFRLFLFLHDFLKYLLDRWLSPSLASCIHLTICPVSESDSSLFSTC